MKLLIIRHADPDYAADSLTPAGWREAALLAERLENTEITKIYCSPLGRARDTASLTLRRKGMEATELEWLREFSPRMTDPDTGLERVAWDWLPQRWTQEPAYFDRDRWCHTPEMEAVGVPAESAWVCRGLDEFLARHGYVREGELYRAVRPNRDTVALFCHLGVGCVLLAHLIGASPMVLWHGLCPRTSSITTLITEERRPGVAVFRINAMGDTAHLYAAGVEPSFAARFCETNDSEERHD